MSYAYHLQGRFKWKHSWSSALCCVVLACLWRPPATAGEPDSAAIHNAIRAMEAQEGGHLGMMAVNLRTGEEIRYNASERFPTASVIKLAVMSAYYDQVKKGLVDPADTVVLHDADKKPGSGILQDLSAGDVFTLRDAVHLMIVLSDNTATNLVLDHLGPDLPAQLSAVNTMMDSLGLHDTRLLNRLFSWQTKQNTPEGIRYGLGYSTPQDMVTLMTMIYKHRLVDSVASDEMLNTLELQQDNAMIPRLLPYEGRTITIAHKTGAVTETRNDVGLVLSDSVAFAIAIFVDKSGDHAWSIENHAMVLGARVARYVWDLWAPASAKPASAYDVDWTRIPGGQWGIYRSRFAPFPHPQRAEGFSSSGGTFFPYFPHYADSSIVVFVPDSLRTSSQGVNMIVHFHGHDSDNLRVLERYGMVEAMMAKRVNAVLVLPQGPYRARDSFGGKMEDPDGLRLMVDDVLRMLADAKVIAQPTLDRLIISAHSGGYRPAAFAVERGGETTHIDDLFLFDALYDYSDVFAAWLDHSRGKLWAAFTEHLRAEHEALLSELSPIERQRVSIVPAGVEHDQVVQRFFPVWLERLPAPWHW